MGLKYLLSTTAQQVVCHCTELSKWTVEKGERQGGWVRKEA